MRFLYSRFLIILYSCLKFLSPCNLYGFVKLKHIFSSCSNSSLVSSVVFGLRYGSGFAIIFFFSGFCFGFLRSL